MIPKLHIVRTADGHGLPLPTYESQHHIGLRLQAAIPNGLKLEAGERVYIPVGFAIGVPKGFCGQIVSLPELVRDKGLLVMSAPHILNPADRGPLFILIQNESRTTQIIKRGDFVAELLIVPVQQICWNEIDGPEETDETPEEIFWIDGKSEETTASELKVPEENKRRVKKSIRSRVKAADEK
ncbi:MAG: hypothetical protein IJY92_06905 [Alphaproteobacteria bacterium]|nr:hypothetical protein [Alphaproteobacteria bacterium]